MTEEVKSLKDYQDFVENVTSGASNDHEQFHVALDALQQSGVHVPLFLTAALGLSGESGEFADTAKKLIFHGKPMSEEIRFGLEKELGDILWYWVNGCRALGLDPQEVMKTNVKKLNMRYDGGKFNVKQSENRTNEL